MDCMEYKSYYFKETEWNTILAGLGVTEWFGLNGEEKESEQTQKNAHKILADLYRKNVMDWENNCAVIKRPFSDLFDTLLKSRYCITVRKQKERTPLRCCYIGEKDVAVTEKSQREEDTLCVFSLSKEDFISFVLETAEAPEGISGGNGYESLAESEELISLKLRDCRNGQWKRELILEERGLQTFLIVKKSDVMREPYRRRRLEEYLREWLYKEDER